MRKNAINYAIAGCCLLLSACETTNPKSFASTEEMLRKADDGSAEAQFKAGIYYQNDKKDDKTAAYWYRMAAEQGHPQAELAVARNYRDGAGVAQDRGLACNWYLKAALQGNKEAQDEFVSLLKGRKELQFYAEILFDHSSRLAGVGDANARYVLAWCYREGLGTTKNKDECFKWMSMAAEQGDANAQFEMGNIYCDSSFGTLDEKLAIEMYKKAQANGHPLSPEAVKLLDPNYLPRVRGIGELPTGCGPDCGH